MIGIIEIMIDTIWLGKIEKLLILLEKAEHNNPKYPLSVKNLSLLVYRDMYVPSIKGNLTQVYKNIVHNNLLRPFSEAPLSDPDIRKEVFLLTEEIFNYANKKLPPA